MKTGGRDPSSVESIIAGARGGYFNQLVTDPATAEAILARLEDSGV